MTTHLSAVRSGLRACAVSTVATLGMLSCAGLAACGGDSPTTPTTEPRGGLAVTVDPNPVPFSGLPSSVQGCAGSANTWHWTYAFTETGGVDITVTERVHFVDQIEIRREAGFFLRANRTVPQATSTCVADATTAHTYSTRFIGTDANNNAFSYTVPAFQLLPRSPVQIMNLDAIANAPNSMRVQAVTPSWAFHSSYARGREAY